MEASPHLLCRILSDDELNVHSEERVYEAVLAWIKFDLDERRVGEHLPTTSPSLPTTYHPLTNHILWPHTNHIPATFWPHTDHITRLLLRTMYWPDQLVHDYHSFLREGLLGSIVFSKVLTLPPSQAKEKHDPSQKTTWKCVTLPVSHTTGHFWPVVYSIVMHCYNTVAKRWISLCLKNFVIKLSSNVVSPTLWANITFVFLSRSAPLSISILKENAVALTRCSRVFKMYLVQIGKDLSGIDSGKCACGEPWGVECISNWDRINMNM